VTEVLAGHDLYESWLHFSGMYASYRRLWRLPFQDTNALPR
jgi:hypothetical protein